MWLLQAVPTGPLINTELLKWILDQGGVFATLMVILFFYRRDFKSALDTVMNLVQQNIKAYQESKAQIEAMADQNAEVLNELRNAIHRLANAQEVTSQRHRHYDDRHDPPRDRSDPPRRR